MPIIAEVGTTGSVSVRSTARPPDSTRRTMIFASSGRVVSGSLSSETENFALPFSSVWPRSSSVCWMALASSSSLPTPNV